MEPGESQVAADHVDGFAGVQSQRLLRDLTVEPPAHVLGGFGRHAVQVDEREGPESSHADHLPYSVAAVRADDVEAQPAQRRARDPFHLRAGPASRKDRFEGRQPAADPFRDGSQTEGPEDDQPQDRDPRARRDAQQPHGADARSRRWYSWLPTRPRRISTTPAGSAARTSCSFPSSMSRSRCPGRAR